MPYKIDGSGSGFKVTSPNHPHGFSKEPQTKQMAIKQMVAIKMHDGEGGKKVGVKGRHDPKPKKVGVKKT